MALTRSFPLGEFVEQISGGLAPTADGVLDVAKVRFSALKVDFAVEQRLGEQQLCFGGVEGVSAAMGAQLECPFEPG